MKPAQKSDERERFDLLMRGLEVWRNENHEDNIVLHRDTVIEIIEGVKALRIALKPDKREPLELCQDCRWVVQGLFLPGCNNRKSDFYAGAVHPHGWCPEWSDQAAVVVPLKAQERET